MVGLVLPCLLSAIHLAPDITGLLGNEPKAFTPGVLASLNSASEVNGVDCNLAFATLTILADKMFEHVTFLVIRGTVKQ